MNVWMDGLVDWWMTVGKEAAWHVSVVHAGVYILSADILGNCILLHLDRLNHE
jgi:hypothetical protein